MLKSSRRIPAVFGSISRACASVRFRSSEQIVQELFDNCHPVDAEYRDIIKNQYDGKAEYEKTAKVRRAFRHNQMNWSKDGRGPIMIEPYFFQELVTPIEMCPERVYDHVDTFRSIKKEALRARILHKFFADMHEFSQEEVILRARYDFHHIFRSIHDHSAENLATKGRYNSALADKCIDFVRTFKAQPDKFRLTDLSETDIISIAPGALGCFQRLFYDYNDDTLNLSVLVCAYYKKQLLYRAVESCRPIGDVGNIFAMDDDTVRRELPSEYGYAQPRMIFAYLDYVYDFNQVPVVDLRLQLSNFQFVSL